MQYRSLTLQESFGLVPLQSFKEGKGMAVKTGSYEVGGKLPKSMLLQRSAEPIMIPAPQVAYAISSNDVLRPRYNFLIIGGLIVLVLIVSIAIYEEYNRKPEEESRKS